MNKKEQREVSSCCGAAVAQYKSGLLGKGDFCGFCKGTQTHNHCFNCKMQCEISPIQPTTEETRQTGSEDWEKQFEGLYKEEAAGKNYGTAGGECLSCRRYVDDDHICDAKFIVSPSKDQLKQFIRDLLAAQLDEVEKLVCKHDRPTFLVPSETISMEEHNKQIIEAVERFVLVMHKKLKSSKNMGEVIEKSLADFKREYGGKE